MTFDDRLSYLLLGMLIGYVLARINRLDVNVKIMKEEVDEIVKIEHDRTEGGFMRHPWIANIAILLTVGLTLYACVVSVRASHDVRNNQRDQATTVFCVETVFKDALGALNARSKYTGKQINANVDLQTDFGKFFDLLLHRPPYPPAVQFKAAKTYQSSQHRFLIVSQKNIHAVSSNAFPKVKELKQCITGSHKE